MEEKHPPFQWLVDTAAGEASPEIEQVVERHLAVCPKCRADYAWLRETLALMQSDFSVEPPAEATARAKAIFRRESKPAPVAPGLAERIASWFRFPRMLPAAATVAIVLVVTILALMLPRQKGYAAVLADGSAQMLVPGGTWEPIRPGDEIPVGAVVQVGDSGPAVLRFPDGSQVHVGKRGSLLLERIEKSKGHWQIVTATDSGTLDVWSTGMATVEVETPGGRCVTRSPGKYSVEVSPTRDTRVNVTLGKLTLTSGDRELSLSAGEEVTLPPIVRRTPGGSKLPPLLPTKKAHPGMPVPSPTMPVGGHMMPSATPVREHAIEAPRPTPPWMQRTPTPRPTRRHGRWTPHPTIQAMPTVPAMPPATPSWGWSTPTPRPTRRHRRWTPHPTAPATPTMPAIPSATPPWGWSTPTPEPTHERATQTPHPTIGATPTIPAIPSATPSWGWSTPAPEPTHWYATGTPHPTVQATPTVPAIPSATPPWGWSTPTPEPTRGHATGTPHPTVQATPTVPAIPSATPPWGWSTPTPHPR